jgi:hypothetical protein
MATDTHSPTNIQWELMEHHTMSHDMSFHNFIVYSDHAPFDLKVANLSVSIHTHNRDS